jgi:hypothetical protein
MLALEVYFGYPPGLPSMVGVDVPVVRCYVIISSVVIIVHIEGQHARQNIGKSNMYPFNLVGLLMVWGSAAIDAEHPRGIPSPLPIKDQWVTIQSATWSGVLEQLADQLKVRIVSFVPDHFTPLVLKGPAQHVLARMAEHVQGVWHLEDRLLVLRLALEHLPMRPATSQEKVLEKKKAWGIGRFILSLEPEQLQRLSQGEGLPVHAFSKAQQLLLGELVKPPLVPVSPPLFLREGKIYSSLRCQGQVFWRGTDLHLFTQEGADHWLGDRYWRVSRAWPRRALEPLMQQVAKKFMNKEWSFSKTTVLSLAAIGQGVSTWRRGKGPVVVSAQVAQQQVVVTTGSWPVARLLGAIAWACSLEWREVEDIIFLGPVQEALQLQMESEEAHDCDVSWALWEPIFRAGAKNPRNGMFRRRPFLDLSGMSGLEIWRPQLLAWQALSPIQREYALNMLGLGKAEKSFPFLGPEALRRRWSEVVKQYPMELELFIYPSFFVEFVWPGQPDPEFPPSIGKGPSYTYGWLATRFGSGRRGVEARLPVPSSSGERE